MAFGRVGIGSFAVSLPLLALGTAAHAQQVDEIVVTAQKREGSLQRTPIAITAFSEDSIENNHIEGVSDVALRTPGLVFGQTTADTTVTLRGVGLNISGLGGEPAVAAYQDGVYLGQSFTMALPQFDLARIEVLRGPQGTLYGRNATGGAINLITRLPEFTPGADLAFSVGNYNHIKAEAGVTGGVSDAIALRASAVYDYRQEGYRRNIAVGGRTGGSRTIGANLAALIKPTDNLTLTLRGNYLQQRSGDGTWQVIQLAPPAGTLHTPANVGGLFTIPDPALGGATLADVFGLTFPTATAGATPSRARDLIAGNDIQNLSVYRVAGASATIDWEIGGVNIKSITAYRDLDWKGLTDEDATNLHLFHDNRTQQGRTWSQEFNFSGSLFNDRVDWFVGAFYYHDKSRAELFVTQDDTQRFYEALVGLFTTGAPLAPGGLQTLTANNPLGQTVGWGHQGISLATPFVNYTMAQESTSYAIFGEAKYHITDQFALTLGGRWTRDEKDVTRSFGSNYVSQLAPSSLCVNQQDSASWSQMTGNVVAEYTLDSGAMIYGKIARGYKAGGFNIGECGAPFNPETITSYEGGVKARFFDGQLQANTAMFYYDYQDIQILRFLNNSASVENAASGKIFGIEAEVAIAPRALSGFRLSGSVGYLDTRYGDAAFSDPFAGGEAIDVSGNRLMRAPRWKASLAAEYAFQTGIGEFRLMGDANYTSTYFFDVFEASRPNQSEMRQPAYTIVNLRASWTSRDGGLQLTAFADNVTNRIYADARMALTPNGAIYGQFSAPRTYGLRLSAKFGGARS